MKNHLLLLSLLSLSAQAEPLLKFGGYLNAYYASDFNLSTGTRQFTNNFARANNIDIDLVYVEATVHDPKLRGRLALQTGTAAAVTYATEPALLQFLQEGWIGYQVTKELSIDAGLYFSHIGMESFITRDNWALSQSMVTVFAPTYQTGVRMAYEFNQSWKAQLHFMNGWQRGVDNNAHKSVGMQVEFTPSKNIKLIYNNYIGEETGLRWLHDFIAKFVITEKWQAAIEFDLGTQTQVWYGVAALIRSEVSKQMALGVRLEWFNDPQQRVVTTGTANGFQVMGASANFDWALDPRLVWRSEVRFFSSRDAIYTQTVGPGSTSSGYFITSLSLNI